MRKGWIRRNREHMNSMKITISFIINLLSWKRLSTPTAKYSSTKEKVVQN